MQKIKDFILNDTNKTFLAYIILVFRYKRKNKSLIKTLGFAVKALIKFYAPSKKYSKGMQLQKLFKKINIKINDNYSFVYNIDIYKTIHRDNRIIDNISIDYNKILNNSLKDFRKQTNKLKESTYKQNQIDLLDGMEIYIDRLCENISKSKKQNKENIIEYLQNIKDKKPQTFEEAVQRILFYNQLLWQTGHGLNGLGRLDKILDKYYQNDIKKDILTKEKAKTMLTEMLQILHEKLWWKSNVLIGDTGQIIILGGKEKDGTYFYNDLTYLFVEIVKELNHPDPKVLLRVSKNTPRNLLELALTCVKTGNGSPLFSNDEVVISKLIDFGYTKEDAHEYVTAACWEPLIAGKSIDQNNIDSIVYMTPFIKLLEEEDLSKIKTYKSLLDKYKEYLKQYIIDFSNEINQINWEEAPLFSLLTDNCNKNLKDISQGGAIYNNYGLTAVSLGNTVNSLYNLKKYVFEEKKYTLEEINEYRKNNFENHEDIIKLLKKEEIRFGTENKEIIDLTNEITQVVDKTFDNIKNPLGGRYKFGFSAPTYIIKSTNMPASFDGRKNGEPFGVHISSDKAGLAYTELIQFASKLDYTNHRFNGNVIDFMITPSFIENNFEKMVDFIILSISLGFFQMQMNVTSSEILIKAKANPKEYENLIVRVWGFSAYFNDLPEEYKDLLIERALKNEGKA